MAIKKEKILAGDILAWKVTGASSILAKIIGFFSILSGNQGSYHRTYAHVAICENENNMIEMTFPKSKRSPIKYDDPELELWRVPIATIDQCRGAVAWAIKNIGLWYNLRHLLSLAMLRGYGCSDFVANAYDSVGINLSIEGANDKVVSPNEICDSKETRRIDG